MSKRRDTTTPDVDGASWIILGSGPSQSTDDIESVRGKGAVVAAVNNTLFDAPWADMVYSCSAQWWANYTNATAYPREAKILEEFGGMKCSSDPAAAQFGASIVTLEDGDGLGTGGVRSGLSSGYQAINIAALSGARLIIICGFDTQYSIESMVRNADSGRHYHRDHPSQMGNFDHPYEVAARYPALAGDLMAAGIEVINASRDTSLTCFTRLPLADALKRITSASRKGA